MTDRSTYQSTNPTAIIWYQDVVGFVTNKEHLLDIIPDKSQTLIEQLNCAMRFAIYFTIILLIVKQDIRVLYFTVFVAAVTWIIYYQSVHENVEKKELFDMLNIQEDAKKRPCVKPTKDNPFMNVTALDYTDFTNRPKACSINDSKEETSALFEQGLHRTEDDVYFKSASDRQFFTMPFTTIPNDQKGFAEWLYKTAPTCKENGLKCYGANTGF